MDSYCIWRWTLGLLGGGFTCSSVSAVSVLLCMSFLSRLYTRETGIPGLNATTPPTPNTPLLHLLPFSILQPSYPTTLLSYSPPILQPSTPPSLSLHPTHPSPPSHLPLIPHPRKQSHISTNSSKHKNPFQSYLYFTKPLLLSSLFILHSQHHMSSIIY